MAKPRQAAIDAHISGYTMPRFADEDWEDLERIGGVVLDDAKRATIQDAANQYTEETLLQLDGATRAKMLGQTSAGRKRHKKLLKLEIFRKAMRQVVSAWSDADGDPVTARLLADFAAEIECRSKRALDFQQIQVDLEVIDISLQRFLDRMADSVVPIGGAPAQNASPANGKRPSLDHPFNSLVGRLAKIFKKAGGKVTTPTLISNSIRVSLFVAFVIRVNDNLPENAKQQHASEAAWSKAVARALRS